MRPFTDYETTQEYTDFQKLPAGAYEVKIIRAEDSDDALCLLFDIDGGEFDSFYHKKFADDKKSFGNKAKYKGVLRVWYPDGGEYDDNKKRRLKTVLKTICEDNSLSIDFTKEWDGADLKGAHTGVIFRDTEWEYEGKTGVTALPYTIISLEKLKSGEFTIPEIKRLKNSGFTDVTSLVDEDDDLDF